VWLDKDEYRTQKIDFYDRKKSLFKSLEVSGYLLYEERFWRASKMAMKNIETGKKTELHWSDFEFSSGLSASDFTKNSIKRAR
jgi:Outer membrane lipoprotein-sorting protein